MKQSGSLPHLLTKAQCDSVGRLQTVTKGVYVMQSAVSASQYRFGGIGVKQSNSNTALRRLGQCVNNKIVPVVSWNYCAVLQLPDSTTGVEVKRYEDILKESFFGPGGPFGSSRVPRKDAFETNEHALVLATFHKAIESASA